MAKHGLRKIWILKDQIGLIWEKKKTVWEKERRRRKEEEEEEEEEEGGTKIKQSQAPKRYGTTWTSNALNGSPCWYSH